MNVLTINKVHEFLAPIPSETMQTMHAIQVNNPLYVTHPIIIQLQITEVICYIYVKKHTSEWYVG